MRNLALARKIYSTSIAFLLTITLLIPAAFAQAPADQAPPPSFSPEQLDKLVSRIALYPDPLLAQVLTASTFPDQIPDAARWADEHHYLTGEELSLLVLSDGKHAVPLVAAQDHKRIGEGDTGPNTGGMGAYSTDTMLDAQMGEWILHHIAQKTVDGMAAEETPFVGVLYCGLMMTAKGPMVLEFNARFGDPETQAILPRMESDLVEVLEACVEGRLSETSLRWTPGASACVVAASAGYPGSYETGKVIAGLEEAIPASEVAGTRYAEQQMRMLDSER